MFSDGASQLGYLDLPLVVPLETGEHDLPLAWLESIHHARDRTLVVHVREENQLLVDEVRVGDGGGGLSVEERLVESILPPLSALLEPASQPLLTSINKFLTECLNKMRNK